MRVTILVSPPLADAALNALFAAAWPGHTLRAFAPVLRHSLAYLGAFTDDQLVGFVNLAGDGGVHAVLLDPTVPPDWQRRGLDTRLVRMVGRQGAGVSYRALFSVGGSRSSAGSSRRLAMVMCA